MICFILMPFCKVESYLPNAAVCSALSKLKVETLKLSATTYTQSEILHFSHFWKRLLEGVCHLNFYVQIVCYLHQQWSSSYLRDIGMSHGTHTVNLVNQSLSRRVVGEHGFRPIIIPKKLYTISSFIPPIVYLTYSVYLVSQLIFFCSRFRFGSWFGMSCRSSI